MKTINFSTTKTDGERIRKIVTRAVKLAPGIDRLTLDMDITACHANGCRLDLGRLLDAPDFDFAHDVFGISRHINRENGQLMDCFVPRMAIGKAQQ